MEFRNPAYNAYGTIDCEINHPDYGWIPHTIPADEHPRLQADAIEAGPVPYVMPDQSVTIAAERRGMYCTPMHGQLALGETNWGIILAWRDTQATWAQKVIIDSAQTWVRNSQNIAFFAYLLNFTDEQTDDLFRTAMGIDV